MSCVFVILPNASYKIGPRYFRLKDFVPFELKYKFHCITNLDIMIMPCVNFTRLVFTAEINEAF